MPMAVRDLGGDGELYADPFVGTVNHTVAVRVDVSALTNTLVDANGYLKIGTLLTRAGIPIGAGGLKYGAVRQTVKVAANNGAALATAPDIDVTVAVICTLNRAVMEDNFGRVLNADELANPAGSSPIVLLY